MGQTVINVGGCSSDRGGRKPTLKDWREEVVKFDGQKEHEGTIIKKMEACSKMWDCHPGQLSLARHQIEIMSVNTRSIHCALYRAGPKSRQLAATKMDDTLKQYLTEPETTKWVSPVVLTPKKDDSLCFCDVCRKFNAVAVRHSYHLHAMDV